MTRHYEVVYIFDSALEEAQVNEHLERFHALIATPDKPDQVPTVNHWGKRTLAYPIGRKDVGYYVVTQFETEPTLLPEFERAIKLNEGVIRYLVVLNEGEAPRSVRVGGDSDDDSNDNGEESE